MSKALPPNPAKLFIAVFLNDKTLFEDVALSLSKEFGEIDIMSDWAAFDNTSYYEKEMGKNLQRRIIIFQDLIKQSSIADIKHFSIRIEKKLSNDGNRNVNIDPGYILMERFVLATCKNFAHKIYVGKGVYADLTLIYKDGKYNTLPWTFPNYKDPKMIDFISKVREKYIIDLKNLKSGTKKI
ncbi:MAG: DUF4416 family protein [Desulfobacterales bacterium]|nr:DUF4416 family protein [Desulfobacterales bacterium]MCP4164053.1 DUF4416 family protein [Deltaproteobacteria bacterium]